MFEGGAQEIQWISSLSEDLSTEHDEQVHLPKWSYGQLQKNRQWCSLEYELEIHCSKVWIQTNKGNLKDKDIDYKKLLELVN